MLLHPTLCEKFWKKHRFGPKQNHERNDWSKDHAMAKALRFWMAILLCIVQIAWGALVLVIVDVQQIIS